MADLSIKSTENQSSKSFANEKSFCNDIHSVQENTYISSEHSDAFEKIINVDKVTDSEISEINSTTADKKQEISSDTKRNTHKKRKHSTESEPQLESAKMRIPKTEYTNMKAQRDIQANACVDITNVTPGNEVTQNSRSTFEYSDESRSSAVSTSPSNANMITVQPSNVQIPMQNGGNGSPSLAPVTPEEAAYYQELADAYNQHHSENVSPVEIAQVVQRLSPVHTLLPSKPNSPVQQSSPQASPIQLQPVQTLSPVQQNISPVPQQHSSDGSYLENQYYTTAEPAMPVTSSMYQQAPANVAPVSAHAASANQGPSPKPLPVPAAQNYPMMIPPPAHKSSPMMPVPPMPHHMMPGYAPWMPWQHFMSPNQNQQQQKMVPFATPPPPMNNMYNPMAMMPMMNQANTMNKPVKPELKISPSTEQLDEEKNMKRARRCRTRITDAQLARLEELFEEDSHPDSYRREEIAIELGFTDEVVRVWFKNRRARTKKIALKQKRIAAAIAKTSTDPTVNSTPPQITPIPYGYSMPTLPKPFGAPYQPINAHGFSGNASPQQATTAECYSPVSSVTSGGSHAASPVAMDYSAPVSSAGYTFKPIDNYTTNTAGYVNHAV